MEDHEMIHKYIIPDWLKNITPIPKGTTLNFLLTGGMRPQIFEVRVVGGTGLVPEHDEEGRPILARDRVNYSIRGDIYEGELNTGNNCNIFIEFTDNKQSKIIFTVDPVAGANRVERLNRDKLLFDTNQEWWLQLARLRLSFSKGSHERLGIDTPYNQLPDEIVKIIVRDLEIFVGHDRDEPLEDVKKRVIVPFGNIDEMPIFKFGTLLKDMEKLKIGVIKPHLALKSDEGHESVAAGGSGVGLGAAADEEARRLALAEEETASELARLDELLIKARKGTITPDEESELSGLDNKIRERSWGGGKRKKTKRKKRKSYKKRPKKRRSKRKRKTKRKNYK